MPLLARYSARPLFVSGVLLMAACASQSSQPDSDPANSTLTQSTAVQPEVQVSNSRPGIAESAVPSPVVVESSLAGKVIVLDPGHGGTAETDHFRVGPGGEREEWINLRVALFLKTMIEARGGRVLMTREADVPVELKDRAMLAVDNQADVFLSIHHNATADRSVNFPIIYYHGNASGNAASVNLATVLGRRIAEALYDTPPPISVVSDHVIFPGAGAAVLRHSFGIPGVIGEASFFSNPSEERRLMDPEYNRREAEAYVLALEDFLASPPPSILDRYQGGRIPALETLQESERMDGTAERWREDYEMGIEMLERAEMAGGRQGEIMALQRQAMIFFARSARSFPDSPVARDCHARMAKLHETRKNTEEAIHSQRRVGEYYAPVPEGKVSDN